MIRGSWTTGGSIEATLELWASLRDIKGRIRPLFQQERTAASATAQQQMVLIERGASVLAGFGDQTAGRGSISCPIAQRKAAISRAIAVVTTVWRLPAAISLR